MHPIPSPVKDPTRRRPSVGGFRGPAATCADPGKGIATQRLLRPKLKTRTESKTPNQRSQLKASDPQAKLAAKSSNRSSGISPFRKQFKQLTKISLKWHRTTRPMATECVPPRVLLHEETPNPEAFITKLQRTRSKLLLKKASN